MPQADNNTPSLAPEMTAVVQTPVVVPPALIYRKVIHIQVPANTPWDAEQAKRLMVALFAVGCPLNLVIRASEYQIAWSLEVGDDYKTPVMSAIQATYPTATIQVVPKANPDADFYRYVVDMAGPSLAPIEDVLQFKKHDPLAGLVAAMKNLQAGEALVYELILGHPSQDYARLGEQFLRACLIIQALSNARKKEGSR
ncbi:MAG: hypothetical protein M3Q45_14980 [Chloroflexota bacterium]|nr:hypothetical protein [Chloroflexota bacterium]